MCLDAPRPEPDADQLNEPSLDREETHDELHTPPSRTLADGEDPVVVQRRTGHANIGITLNTYRHVLPDEQRLAVRGSATWWTAWLTHGGVGS